MKCYLFDIDGTLADCSHRIHHIQGEKKDWDAFYDSCSFDKPISHVIDLLVTLHDADQNIVLVSGRSDQCRDQTLEWLNRHGVPDGLLYMRKEGDHRPDDIIKLELLAQLRADGFDPIMAFDDRDRVVKAWRSAGVPCAQVAEGDF